MIALIRVEVARALSRRLVRVLIGSALVAIATAGVLAFANTHAFDDAAQARARTQLATDVKGCITEGVAEQQCRLDLQLGDYDKSLPLTDLWPQHRQDPGTQHDPVLSIAIMLLVFGALLAGASVVGAEWRAGTVATLLTWEPRRARVATARMTTCAGVAAIIAIVLQALFIAALLPAMLLHGGTAGVDASWFAGLMGAIGKGAVLTAFAALIGAAFALIGRNTAVALGAAFVYLNLMENIVRSLRPGMARWLIVNNADAFLMGSQRDLPAASHSLVVLIAYAAVIAGAATAVFHRRDIAA